MNNRLFCLVCAVFTLLLCAFALLKANNPHNGVGGGPAPLTPREATAAKEEGRLETAAKSAKARGDYATAATDFQAETQVPHFPAPNWTWIELGLMRDRQGKRNEAFTAYQKGFGPANRRAGGTDPEIAEAVARFGAMCEDRGRHADACECYYASRTMTSLGDTPFLGYTLDANATSASLVRSLLNIQIGIALEQEWPRRHAEAMAAFRAAVRLAPRDPRPQYFLAAGFRRAGRFAEADAALHKASQLDKGGRLKVAVEKSLEQVNSRSQRS